MSFNSLQVFNFSSKNYNKFFHSLIKIFNFLNYRFRQKKSNFKFELFWNKKIRINAKMSNLRWPGELVRSLIIEISFSVPPYIKCFHNYMTPNSFYFAKYPLFRSATLRAEPIWVVKIILVKKTKFDYRIWFCKIFLLK